ncbi:MAG: alpha/beta hydrolase [Novosphingobium sp. 28-62-57]|uniref:alpha/beta fold hydrolase n=1 Tax=unclassified Novosphingobium TaxID=2644732 RepID=UPI000BCB1B81|nr:MULTISPECIES: alpha/beta hydrolase [unclassified Novosphingobium]OYW51048.1 MAG: alpha/beta hydrolase [Novosphingobium sp. 12-62-10]OYZ11132.1 MAG: alpha/beta hydrolase [Novosphingobium sp. 28-62-57]OYZ43593.1 MAG: alpha/beta hydrolase [Novosphingobium sp. 16-62-11]
MADYEDRYWTSSDGLRLHFRYYESDSAKDSAKAHHRPPVICLPGLTRNARDFEDLAAALAGEWRVLCPEMRGRGDSDYAKDPMTYTPLQYLQDVQALLAQEEIDRFISIGTSLGGLLTMLLAATNPQCIVAAVLNDIGPEVSAAGLERIRGYVGQGRNFETWMHAARALQESSGDVYPDWDIAQWLKYAKRIMVLGSGGRIAFDYDMKIAEPFEAPAGATPQVDMWPMFDALATRPLLVLRGETSDILSAETAANMASRPGVELVTLPRIGHAPTLDEPESIAAIRRLLARV